MDESNREQDVLQAGMMGDIREDIQFLGLTIQDIGWAIGLTLVIGGFPFILPAPLWFKLFWVLVVLIISLSGRWLKWPFRLRRLYHHARQPKNGSGESMEDLLGAKPDGWLYRSGDWVHVVISVNAPPWGVAVLSQKKQRLAGFENFLRACAREGFEAAISAEQVGDYQHAIWNAKRASSAASEGIARLRAARLDRWQQLAESGEAQRSEYILRLSLPDRRITIRQRDDEPSEATKEELKRFRMMTELREMLGRVMLSIEQGGHTWNILSGFSIPEILGRWWDPITWETWKARQSSWEEDDPLVEPEVKTIELSKEAIPLELEVDSKGDEVGTSGVVAPQETSAQPEETGEEQQEAVMRGESTEENEPHPADLVQSAIHQAQGQKKTGKWRLATRMTTFIAAVKKAITALLQQLGMLYTSIMKRLKTRKKRGEATPPMGALESSSSEVIPADPLPDLGPNPFAEGVYVLSSPAPSGRSFIAVNLAVAYGGPITLIELSPDRGCHTLLNPLLSECSVSGWETWVSKHAPACTLWLPQNYPEPEMVQQIVQEALTSGPVFIDLPWDYPRATEIFKFGKTVAVVDCDYHHWLRWEKAELDQVDEVWLNQADPEMQRRMTPLLKKRFGREPSLTFPYFSDAAKALFQGRPLAADPQTNAVFDDLLERKRVSA
ncbi:hypothetical protein NYE69_12630 [Paenibacillus sp. FSL R5-0527]|uniref:hypothetical protein n=1 Tax=Paenibacillus sp. FSL R5-0527 TaxID=2975321 RepID=UPI00097AAE7E|nr:hypothetical protein BK140_16870 [Paenibacillus macerans]